MTVNDIELNELMVRAATLTPIVSHYVRIGNLNAALDYGSELEDVVRKLNWRLLALKEGKT